MERAAATRVERIYPAGAVLPDPATWYADRTRCTVRSGQVAGDADVRAAETQCVVTPREPWQDRECQLTVLAAVEDTAGKRVGRPLEVGTSDTSAGGGSDTPTRRSLRPTGTENRDPSAASATR